MRTPRAPRPEEPFEIWTQIVGVHIGERKDWAEKYCHRDTPLKIEPEPENEVDRNAIAVGVTVKGFWRERTYLVGYLPRADAETVNEHLARGCSATGWVYSKKWTDDGRLYVNINVLLSPPKAQRAVATAPLKPAPPIGPPQPRFKPKLQIALPETWLQRGVLVATFLVAEGIGFVLLGILIGPMLGRQSDILGLGVVATAVGAGMWALALVARVK